MKIRLAFLLFICILLLTACNSREDVKHMSEKDIIKYVEDAIGEDISLVSASGNEHNNVITYEFKLDDRSATFKVTSVISAMYIDGTQFGNFKEKIYIKYEEGIAESEQYIDERSRIAEELNIKDEDMKYGLAIIHVNNYKDIDKVTQFAVKIDELYGFKEKKPERIEHIELGAISFSEPGNSIDGPKFTTKTARLKYKDVYNKIVTSYISHLKEFGIYDNTIPKSIWEKTTTTP